jgi:hypothetical protein
MSGGGDGSGYKEVSWRAVRRTGSRGASADTDDSGGARLQQAEEGAGGEDVLLQYAPDPAVLGKYRAMETPMTDLEAFSAVLDVLARFKWQFVDRSSCSADASPRALSTSAQARLDKYWEYLRALDDCVVADAGGVEYSASDPLRPSPFYFSVVQPSMACVGSVAAASLYAEMAGGSGPAGADDLLARARRRKSMASASASPPSGAAGDAVPLGDTSAASAPVPPVVLNSVLEIREKLQPPPAQQHAGGCLSQEAASGSDGMRCRCPAAAASEHTSSSSSALLQPLPLEEVERRRAAHSRSVAELERARDRETLALLWALERCLLALDIQSQGGATLEALSTFTGYMMEGMDGAGEAGG